MLLEADLIVPLVSDHHDRLARAALAQIVLHFPDLSGPGSHHRPEETGGGVSLDSVLKYKKKNKIRSAVVVVGSHLVSVSQTDPVARIEDGRQILGDLALTELGDVAQPGELVVEGQVGQLLQHHGQHPPHPGHRGEPLLRQRVQQVGDELQIVQGSNPDGTSDMMRVGAELAVCVDWRPRGSAVLHLSLAQSNEAGK